MINLNIQSRNWVESMKVYSRKVIVLVEVVAGPIKMCTESRKTQIQGT
jgi:hypothetical protein